MAHSSHGSRRMAAWATAQRPRAMPRVVRLGRAANDNTRQPNLRVRLVVAGSVLVLAALALLSGWPV
ncbi:hypothetical protein [Reyranella sp.]|uniref:hypothetical protein n=1 Tax=Reyranella sp. TaxID=1929291 RepID=UPI003D141643